MKKITFFTLAFVLVSTVSACKSLPLPTESPLTPTPFESPLGRVERPMPPEEEQPLMDFLDLLQEAAQATQLYTILGLIALDFVLGVSAAIRKNEFDWAKLGEFYRTNVMPYGLGYFCLYIVFAYVPGLEGMVGEGLQWTAFGVLTGNLLGSISSNLGELGITFKR
jgi:hypothetical protein